MPLSVTCTGCGARLNAPAAAAGKSVRCPGCQVAVRVPAADHGFEVVGDSPPRPAAARPAPARPVAAKPARPSRVADDDEDDRPQPTRSARRPRDDDEPRPAKAARRSRDDDEPGEDDDRPRAKTKKKGGLPVWVFAAGGGAALVFLLVAGAAILYLTGATDPTPPPGWSLAKNADGNYRVFLPGQAVDLNQGMRKIEQEARANGVANFSTHRSHVVNPTPPEYATVRITSYPIDGTAAAGTDTDSLYKLLTGHELNLDAKWNHPPEKTPVTLGGKPGLEVRVRKNPHWMDKDFGGDHAMPTPAHLTGEAKRNWEESQRRFNEVRAEQRRQVEKNAQDQEKRAEHTVYYVATNGKRVIVIQWQQTGEYPPADKLKVIADSFKFL